MVCIHFWQGACCVFHILVMSRGIMPNGEKEIGSEISKGGNPWGFLRGSLTNIKYFSGK